MHHVTPELLAWAFHQLKVKAAPGVDGVTWEEYAGALDVVSKKVVQPCLWGLVCEG